MHLHALRVRVARTIIARFRPRSSQGQETSGGREMDGDREREMEEGACVEGTRKWGTKNRERKKKENPVGKSAAATAIMLYGKWKQFEWQVDPRAYKPECAYVLQYTRWKESPGQL